MRKLTRFLETYQAYLREPGNEDTYSEASERLGYLLFEAKRYADAIHPLNEALAFPGTDERKRQLCLYFGFCHFETGNVAAAEQKLVKSLPSSCEDPLWAKAQFHLGRVYFQKGAYTKAKEAFELCEFFGDEANAELKQGLSTWLARIATHLPTKNRAN
jgi:tetratricopeptide (TPR) repeat protein